MAEEHYEALLLLIEDAEAEYYAANVLGELPDTEEKLGIGADEVPERLRANVQATVWSEVFAVYRTDAQPVGLRIVED